MGEWTAFHQAVYDGDIESVRKMIKSESNIDALSHDGATGLFIALQNGDKKMVQLLIESGADVNKVWNGTTPLIHAISTNDSELVRLLLENGANPLYVMLKDLATPLHQAAQSASLEVNKILLEKVDNVDPRREDGSTPLFFAASSNSGAVVKNFLDSGADINMESYFGAKILHTASMNGNKEAVDVLIENGADPEERDKFGKTALQYAIENGQKQIVNLLSIQINRENSKKDEREIFSEGTINNNTFQNIDIGEKEDCLQEETDKRGSLFSIWWVKWIIYLIALITVLALWPR